MLRSHLLFHKYASRHKMPVVDQLIKWPHLAYTDKNTRPQSAYLLFVKHCHATKKEEGGHETGLRAACSVAKEASKRWNEDSKVREDFTAKYEALVTEYNTKYPAIPKKATVATLVSKRYREEMMSVLPKDRLAFIRKKAKTLPADEIQEMEEECRTRNQLRRQQLQKLQELYDKRMLQKGDADDDDDFL